MFLFFHKIEINKLERKFKTGPSSTKKTVFRCDNCGIYYTLIGHKKTYIKDRKQDFWFWKNKIDLIRITDVQFKEFLKLLENWSIF